MERKRELTSVDLAAIVGELDAIRGAKVDKAYRYDEDLFRFRMREYDRGRLELLLQVGSIKRAHLADPANVADAPERPPNFARMLRNRIGGADLVDVSQYEFDRILVLDFERHDERTRIVAELFGDGNLIVLDDTGQVVDCVRTIRLRSRTVASGSTYEFPEAQLNPFEVDSDRFAARIRDSDTDVVRTIATRLNLGGTYAEEVCARAGVDGGMSIEDVEAADLERLLSALRELGDRIREGDFSPRIYYDDDVRVDVVPFPLERYADFEYDRFDRFNDAVDAYFHDFDADESTGVEQPTLADEIEKQRRVIDQQESAIERFEREADETRAEAEALYAHYDLVNDILTTIRGARAEGRDWNEIESTIAAAAEEGNDRARAVEEIDGAAGTVTISLGEHRPTISIEENLEQNADLLYQEAKALEAKREGATEALTETRTRLRELHERDEEDVSPEDIEESREWTERRSIPVKAGEQWYERFRWFHTSDDFLVIGGRNADQNEELVKKYLEPGDRFAHAEAHGGPVTILKATDPSERAREVDFPASTLQEMAQFAVSYSSVWKAGQFGGDAYHVSPDQVSKTPESGETLEKGGFVIRGEREYVENVPVGVAIGIMCEPETRVIGGPPAPIEDHSAVSIRVEPGKFAQADVAKRIYRRFRETFEDTAFIRKVASPDRIQEFLPPGHSSIRE